MATGFTGSASGHCREAVRRVNLFGLVVAAIGVMEGSYSHEGVAPKRNHLPIFVHGSLMRVAGRIAKSVAIATLVAVVTGCTVVKPVPESADQEQLRALALTCESHFPLTQDCSDLSGAEKLIVIDEVRIEIAGSAAGDILLVESGNKAGEGVLDIGINLFAPLLLVTPQNIMASQGANTAYSAVKGVLDQSGISIARTHAVRGLLGLDVYGYVIELDGDGYSVLKKYAPAEQSSVEENGEEP